MCLASGRPFCVLYHSFYWLRHSCLWLFDTLKVHEGVFLCVFCCITSPEGSAGCHAEHQQHFVASMRSWSVACMLCVLLAGAILLKAVSASECSRLVPDRSDGTWPAGMCEPDRYKCDL